MSFRYITVLTFLIITSSPYPSFSFNYGEVSGLTEEESAALNQLNSIFNNNIDSHSLQRGGADIPTMQDATMHLMDIRRRWDNWSPEFRAIAGGHFLQKHPLTPETPETSSGSGQALTLSPCKSPPPPFSSPPCGGRIWRGEGEGDISLSKTLMLGRKSVRGTHLLPNWTETANFSIEWGDTASSYFLWDGGYVSGKILACSKGATCTGIPDIVDNWADYFEEAWEIETGGLGYIKPAGSDTYLYDIYIANTRDNISGNSDDKTPTLSWGYLGYTITYCDDYFDICKGDVTDSYSYIVVNGNISDAKTMMTTAAHEFFHAIQFSYPTIDIWYSPDDHWWIEATATWMEEVVYDDANHYYSEVGKWLRNPWLSLKYSGNRYTNHEYGDALFVIFMTDVYLNDRDFVRSVWESDKSGIEAIDDVLIAKYNLDFDSAFKEFIALNAVADRASTWGGYEEGRQYGSAAITGSHNSYPLSFFLISGDNAPQELGSNYIRFLPSDNIDNRLIIEFDGEDGINWAPVIVKVKSDGTGFESYEMVIEPSYKSGCHSIDGFGTVYSEVFLVAAVLVDPGVTDGMPYQYKASLNETCSNTINTYSIQTDSQTTGNNKGDSRCFIATAAFGSSDSPYVEILRDFRDQYLMPYDIGRRFVGLYYKASPSIADFIEQRPPALFFVRSALFPAIGIAFLLIKTSFLEKLIIIAIILSLSGMTFCKTRCKTLKKLTR